MNVKGREITVFTQKEEDYICITDIAKYKNAENNRINYFSLA
jgi:hypothetical protein